MFPCLDGDGRDRPDAVVVDGEATSWSDLASRADALGAELLGAGAVAVAATPTLDTVVAVVAGLRAGVVMVPVPSDAGPMERGHIVRDSGAAIVVGDPDWPDVDLPRVPVPRVGTSPAAIASSVDADDPALLMYTSGTTGQPKGVLLSNRAIAACLDGLAEAWGWTAEDTLVHGLPLFHVHGLVLGVLGSLRAGSRLVHTGRPTAESYAAANGTLYFGVPTVWGRVVDDPAAATSLRSARLLVSGSAALPVPVFDRLRALTGHEPIERYGMTETLITLSTRHDGHRRAGWVGAPIRGVETRSFLDDGSPAPRDGDTIGTLHVRGTTLFDGYLGRPDATAESFTDDGWFVTGDSVVIDEQGMHRIVGRTSIDIIKSGGFKVGAGEIEAALLTHPSVVEVAVVGVPDPDLGERIVAFVVGEAVVPDDLIAYVASAVSVHKRPREIRVVDSLPRNAMGKVQKTLLRG